MTPTRRHYCRSRSQRAGYSLIEMLTVISFLIALMSMAGLMLHGLMKADQAVRLEVQQQQTLLALQQEFRSDVHQSRAVELLPDQAGVLLTRPGLPARRYTTKQRGVQLEQQTEDGNWKFRELYRLDECRIAWQPPGDDTPETWTLLVERPAILLTEPARQSPVHWAFPIQARVSTYMAQSSTSEVTP